MKSSVLFKVIIPVLAGFLLASAAAFAQADPIVVNIDIKPGGCDNPLNVDSKGKLPVVVLGSLDFDVTTIDPASIRLTFQGADPPTGQAAPIRSAKEDVAGVDCAVEGPDGFVDLILKFKTQDVAALLPAELQRGDVVTLVLTGALADGTGTITGEDTVTIKKKKPKKQ